MGGILGMLVYPATSQSPIVNRNRWPYYTCIGHSPGGKAGVNPCILGGHQWGDTICSALTNCVGYCYGRAMETWGEAFTKSEGWYLSYGPQTMWSYAPQNHKRSTPTPGCVGAMSGHVFMVERVYSNGTYDISDSWYSSLEGGKPVFHRYRNCPIGTCHNVGGRVVGYVIPPNVRFNLNPDYGGEGPYIDYENRYVFSGNNEANRIPKYEWRF